MRFGRGNFLQYNARYHVLICRECTYAIQKSAVQSHLLRHKIYREERQRLLHTISKLDILEPDDVPVPESNTAPVEGLAVVSGYRCTAAAGCEHLCASSKRMQRHWRETHSQTNDTLKTRPVRLQTFFRGTKIRYFEVASLPETVTANNDQGEGGVREGNNTAIDVSLGSIDLETLNYFHHFLTTTSHTLPSPEDSRQYWQSDFVTLALQYRWIMGGVLAISVSHLAILTGEEITRRTYHQKLACFNSDFSVGLDGIGDTDPDTEKVRKAGTRVKALLCCAQFSNQDINITAASSLEDFIGAVKSLASSLGFWQTSPNHPSEEVDRPLNAAIKSSSIFNRLCELPYQMAETFGKPDDPRDAIAILSAIAPLIECYSSSFTTSDDNISTTWHHMTRWLFQVPDRFNQMVAAHDASALVLLAYWVALMVERAENGFWFLQGSRRTILSYLPADNDGIQSLVEGLDIH